MQRGRWSTCTTVIRLRLVRISHLLYAKYVFDRRWPLLHLCTRVFRYVHCSFLLISNKFCDLSLPRWVGRHCGKKNLLVLPHSPQKPSYRPCKLMYNVHTENYLWTSDWHGPHVLLLMRANPLLGQVEGGEALKISTFLGPKRHSPNGSLPFHRAQKSLDIQETPSHLYATKALPVPYVRDRINHRSINS